MKSIIATTASLLLLCTGAATAQQSMYEGHQDQLDTDDNGAVNRQEYQAFMTEAFEKLDADNNGALNQAETADVLNADQFASTDASGDGRVSRDEFMNRVMKDFAAADKSGDRRLQ
ncbi:Ca2+-binding EF-hand superfamily protein [Mesorhizobium robiniae]|uniref:Ca2+-binding EF-hand superfamily protein n=1 Tax=Mesorhizobium robiniae TaxID=559315 RepID=A0ABV2GL90_9HYPH